MFTVETYLSPVETHCMNIDYFIPDEENQTRGFSDDAMARLRKYGANKFRLSSRIDEKLVSVITVLFFLEKNRATIMLCEFPGITEIIWEN